MKGITHLVIGLFVALLILEFTNTNSLILVILVLVASLLPDIDERHSLIGRKFPLVGWFSRHRGFFYSIYPAIIFYLIVLFFSFSTFISFFAISVAGVETIDLGLVFLFGSLGYTKETAVLFSSLILVIYLYTAFMGFV